jgi:hypothetical protein
MGRANRFDVAIETGAKRVFASGLDWPGWARGAKTEAEALAALVAYGRRYRAVVAPSPGGFEPPGDVAALEVAHRSKGGAGTDFGVPSNEEPADQRPLAGAELERFEAVLRACWHAFDRAATAAVGVELRKGPRGGGRDLEKIVGHCVEAEEAYLRQLGFRPPTSAAAAAERWPALRRAALDRLERRAAGEPPETQVKRPWTPRYFVRRAAWHVLDHAWEIEDRSAPAWEDAAAPSAADRGGAPGRAGADD